MLIKLSKRAQKNDQIDLGIKINVEETNQAKCRVAVHNLWLLFNASQNCKL